MEALNQLFTIDWDQFMVACVKMLLAYVLAFPIAWNRERVKFTAGLRTFPLVALGATGYLIIANEFFGPDAGAQARILQGLLGGIGFIGGGAILKEGANVKGTATAAGIWVTGAIGAAIAYDHLSIAIVLSVMTFAAFKLLTPFKKAAEKDSEAIEEE